MTQSTLIESVYAYECPQSVPSPLNTVLSNHLSVPYVPPVCCVFGLGSMLPVSNTVMETQFIFLLATETQADRRTRTFRLKPF